jgi:hypothetical protein
MALMGFHDLAPNMAELAVFIPVLTALSLLFLRKQAPCTGAIPFPERSSELARLAGHSEWLATGDISRAGYPKMVAGAR